MNANVWNWREKNNNKLKQSTTAFLHHTTKDDFAHTPQNASIDFYFSTSIHTTHKVFVNISLKLPSYKYFRIKYNKITFMIKKIYIFLYANIERIDFVFKQRSMEHE